MGLRQATLDDLELITDMGMKFAAVSPYKDFCLRPVMREVIYTNIQTGGCFVYDEVGFIMGHISKFIYGVDALASELGWWVEPSHRGTGVGAALIGAFEEWAYANGAHAIAMISLDEEVGRYYAKRGYHLCEHTYFKEF